MSRIGPRNTKPELVLRSELHKWGFRYRLHNKRLPGKPDLVFPKYKAIIFVHGCFWHRHGCKNSTIPSTRTEFWYDKFEQNIKRDKRNILQLKNLGWRVKVVWECQIEDKKNRTKLILYICSWLHNTAID